MKIPVKFLNFNVDSPDLGYWDTYFLEKIFTRPEFEMDHAKGGLIPEPNPQIVVIPGRHNLDHVDKINEYISHLDGVLLILAGDEESLFPLEQLKHPNMKLWLMTPHAGRSYPNVDRFIGENYTPHCDFVSDDDGKAIATMPDEAPEKLKRWFFAGQVTHSRRELCVKELKKFAKHEPIAEGLKAGELIQTPGFTQGISRMEYIGKMVESRVIPCPGGPATPDTFRLYEALEAACIPIVDAYSARNKNEGYWQLLFGDNIPFPIIKNWSELRDSINYFNDTFTTNSNKIFAWWQMYKRNFVLDLIDDFGIVAGYKMSPFGITAIVPTSPIASNPDISIIEETIESIKTHLPNVEIIITFDGVRPEQEEKRANYEEFTRKVLWKCNRVWKNVIPIVFDGHMHQVAMAREALKHVRTNKILYVEHDTPITPDMPIDWDGISAMIDSGIADLVRFHFEAFIPKEHDYLMIDKEPQINFGVPAVRTVQWSQRPHLASTEFYKKILADHFSTNARTFIEDLMHGVVVEAWKRQQLQGWNKFKLWIYHPENNIKRSYHTDGRGAEEKYSMKF